MVLNWKVTMKVKMGGVELKLKTGPRASVKVFYDYAGKDGGYYLKWFIVYSSEGDQNNCRTLDEVKGNLKNRGIDLNDPMVIAGLKEFETKVNIFK
jgi:hypothetical protein